MNILWVTSEAVPFAKTGGLADVSAALPAALAERGHKVSVVMPYYPQLMGKLNLKFDEEHDLLRIPFGEGCEWAKVNVLRSGENLSWYFIEYHRFFDRPNLYDWNGQEYADNAQRYIFLCRAAMELAVNFRLAPDILHANDWHAALCCVYLRSGLYAQNEQFRRTRSVLTIHNIGYQGNFDKGNLYWTGLGWEYFNYLCLEFYDRLNFLKGGIMCADMVSTVSPTYAEEILSPEYGFGLDGALRARASSGRLRGILNGIDTGVWNPSQDRYLPATFSADNLAGKAECRRALQKKYGLEQRTDVPIFAVISRLAYQKGLDVFAFGLDELLRECDYQFVVVTSGDKNIEGYLSYLAGKYPGKFGLYLGYAGEPSAHLVEAGADLFIMPSRYEPCGLNQMYSMTYGTLPLVRHTGGLADTVINYDPTTLDRSTGFVLWDLNAASLNATIRWAADTWKNHPDHIARMQHNGMTTDFSWNHTASHYDMMYEDAHR